ncbi:MAG: sulfite exporter TauE/SafE family protein [Blastocatellia bacterium]|nr:sulfite exporter TauE/SafE family protein [Blastocatellia bacterium]
MTIGTLVLLCLAIAVVAFLYSAVGHAGASGYIAVMTLFGMAASEIKPAALALNILVASLTAWQFWRARHFSWSLFWPFAVFSIPLAFRGGAYNLPIHVFKILIGLVLLYSAARFFITASGAGEDEAVRPPSRPIAFAVGGAIGLLSGLTGTGGGIFLTPLMLFLRWAHTKPASAVSALFILVNSLAGLAGNIGATKQLPLVTLPVAAAAIAGGAGGSYLGSQSFSPVLIKRLLAAVLTIAGIKLLFT